MRLSVHTKTTSFILSALVAVALYFAPAVQAQAADVDLDFTTSPALTPFSSLNGVEFSLSGGPGSNGTPVIGYYGGGLTNSDNGWYPTANILKLTFLDGLASNIAFSFDNEGTGFSGRGASIVTAFDAMGNALETAFLGGNGDLAWYSLASSGIKYLEFNNGTGGTDSWGFGLNTLSASVTPVTSVPGPEAGAGLAGLALAGIGAYAVRRRRKEVAA